MALVLGSKERSNSYRSRFRSRSKALVEKTKCCALLNLTKGKDQLPPTNAIVYYLIITIGGCSPFIITDKAGHRALYIS